MRQSPDAHDSGDGVITTSYLRQPLRRRRRSHRRQEERNKTNTPRAQGTRGKFFLRLGARVRCPLPETRPVCDGGAKVSVACPGRGGEVGGGRAARRLLSWDVV